MQNSIKKIVQQIKYSLKNKNENIKNDQLHKNLSNLLDKRTNLQEESSKKAIFEVEQIQRSRLEQQIIDHINLFKIQIDIQDRNLSPNRFKKQGKSNIPNTQIPESNHLIGDEEYENSIMSYNGLNQKHEDVIYNISQQKNQFAFLKMQTQIDKIL